MLVDFTIKNFRSIKDEQLFSMVAEKRREDIPNNLFCASENDDLFLLKSAAIYGANASGKSNVFKAFHLLTQFVLNSTELKLDEKIPVYEPFLLDVDSQNDTIAFEIEFITKEPMRYRYSIELNRTKIIAESLYFFPGTKGRKLYERDADGLYVFGRELKGQKQRVAEEVLENTLFLSKAANRNDSDEKIKNVYRYFKDTFNFYLMNRHIKTLSRTTLKLSRDNDNNFQRKLIGLLQSADFGISSLRTTFNPLDEKEFEFPDKMPDSVKDKVRRNFFTRVEFKHPVFKNRELSTEDVYFKMAQESTGTVKMYDLAYQIITALENGEVLFIDELDSSFHPLMSAYVFSLFNSPKHNPHNAQLIVTTHDVTLLDSEKLRRDQIWFTEKDAQGASSLYSLDEFKKSEIRKSISFDKWYLSGRFSALPVIREGLFSEYMGDK